MLLPRPTTAIGSKPRAQLKSVEDLFPKYVQWCRDIFQRTALEQGAEGTPEEFLKIIIPRAVRHVRLIARIEGAESAIDFMNTDGTSPLHWVMWKVRREWEQGKEAAERSEDDDEMDEELLDEIGFWG